MFACVAHTILCPKVRMAAVCTMAILVATSLGVESSAQEGALRAEPASVTFSRFEDEARVAVYSGDGRVSAIDKVFIGIENKNYGRMFHVETPAKEPGVLVLRPKPDHVEIGSYDLRIQAEGRQVLVPVFTPLDTLPGLIENRAVTRGVSVQALREAESLVTHAPRDILEIQLPDRFPEGAILILPLGSHGRRHYTWMVNGETVLAGEGESTLRLPVTEPELYAIEVVERSRRVVKAQWRGQLQVVAPDPLEYAVPANTEFALSGPTGYGRHEWRVDGKLVGKEDILRHRFEKPGQHAIECKAMDPVDDNDRVHYRVIWNTTASD